MQVADRFICAKDVDRSLLRQGFTLLVGMLFGFKSWFGVLQPGASRDVTIRMNGAEFSVRLGNRDFDREKWPDHPEMYQMRYTETSAFAKVLREQFKTSRDFIAAELAKFGKSSKRHIQIPADKREQLVFYRTDDPNVWDAEVLTADETASAFQATKTLDEHLFESADWTDAEAGIVLKSSVVKVRRLDRAIGNNLKRIYGHRCQICGLQVSEEYSVSVDEVHHIDPFVISLNNEVSNLLVLCPNHHRIIHAAHPDFRRQTLSFVYPNGLNEKLKINLHLTGPRNV